MPDFAPNAFIPHSQTLNFQYDISILVLGHPHRSALDEFAFRDIKLRKRIEVIRRFVRQYFFILHG
jgi:hypothetical protein